MSEAPITPKELADIIRTEFAQYEISVQSVYLFGSRALGTAKADSDWDFLIITQKDIERPLQRKILTRIRKRLIFEFNLDSDILVLSEKSLASTRADKGRISFYALRDGMAL